MAQITLKNVAGKDAGKVELVEDVFGIQPNVPVMHQVVTAQLAKRRAGTQSTKTRAEVRGGGAKPYRQKGTGNARQGSTNSPHYTGGGVALGPKPRSYAQRTPKKMIKLALRSALSDRASENKVLVIDGWNFETPKTKDAAAAIRALGAEGRVLVVIERQDANAALSFRNIPEVQLIQAGELNAYDVLCNDWIVFTQASLTFVEDGFAAFAAKAKTGAAKPITAEKPAKAAKGGSKAEQVAEPVATEAPAEVAEVRGFADVTSQGAEGSASDEAQAARGGSEADDEPAIQHSFAAVADVADAPTDDVPAGDVTAAEWAGSAKANEDGSQPAGYDIKGNADSMLYHLPDGRWYDATVAEVWFDNEESAIAAGFTKAGARKAAAADTLTEDEEDEDES